MLDSAPPESPSHPRRVTGLRGAVSALRNFGLVGLATPNAGDYDSFTASDGQVVPVCVLGAGPPLVLVHGVGCSHRDWLPVAKRLARRHCVLAWDARGHGSCRPVRGSNSNHSAFSGPPAPAAQPNSAAAPGALPRKHEVSSTAWLMCPVAARRSSTQSWPESRRRLVSHPSPITAARPGLIMFSGGE